MSCFPRLRQFSGPIAAIVLSLIVVDPVGAQPANPPGVDRLIEMNKKALRDYDAANWKAAKNTLLEAVSAGKKAKLETHGIMARTYLHLGVVWIAGFNDRPKAIWSFARALEVDPTIRVRANMETPDVASAFEEAQKEVAAAQAAAPAAPAQESAAGAAAATGGEAAAAPTEQVAPLDCPNSGEAPPEKAVPIKCTVASNLKIGSLHLFYRGPGKKKFASVEMEKGADGAYESEIPEDVVGEGGAIQYYVEGRNASGKPIVSNGHGGSPNILMVHEGAEGDGDKTRPRKGTAQAEEAVEENPLDEETMRRARAAGIARVRGAADARYGNRRFWIGIGGGSGAGYAKGDGLEARPDLQSQYEAGLGWAGLGHLVPEIGYQITPDIAVSLQGRVQWIPQAAQYQKTYRTGAQAVLARVLFFSRQQRFRYFGSLMAGGGTGFRFTLHPDHTMPAIKDTVRGGPGIAGGGGGLSYELLKSISLVAEVNVLAGFPVFSAVADLNLGFQVNIY